MHAFKCQLQFEIPAQKLQKLQKIIISYHNYHNKRKFLLVIGSMKRTYWKQCFLLRSPSHICESDFNHCNMIFQLLIKNEIFHFLQYYGMHILINANTQRFSFDLYRYEVIMQKLVSYSEVRVMVGANLVLCNWTAAITTSKWYIGEQQWRSYMVKPLTQIIYFRKYHHNFI